MSSSSTTPGLFAFPTHITRFFLSSFLLFAASIDSSGVRFCCDAWWPFVWLQLKEVPGLVERMAALMCVDIDIDSDDKEEENDENLSIEDDLENAIRNAKENGDGIVTWLELEELGIDDETLLSLDLSSNFPVFHCIFISVLVIVTWQWRIED